MEKHREDDKVTQFPGPGDRLAVPLISSYGRESFTLDIVRTRIKLTKATFQNRARQSVVLMRLDIDGPPHRNPDGEEIPCPHIHIYREGYGDKWASPLPPLIYPATDNLYEMLEAFMGHCNITEPPAFNIGLF